MVHALFNGTLFKPRQVQVLAPDIECAVMPAGDRDMAMAASIRPAAMLGADVARHFIMGKHDAAYLQLRQPDGKPYMDLQTDGGLKRFYVFALPQTPGGTAHHADPDYMFALQCAVTTPVAGVLSVMPEKILRGKEAFFVLSASFACCASGSDRARVMLYSDTSQSRGPFLNTAFSGAAMRPEIRKVWSGLQVVMLDGVGAQALAHLARDVVGGGCAGHGHLVNPARGGNWRGVPLGPS